MSYLALVHLSNFLALVRPLMLAAPGPLPDFILPTAITTTLFTWIGRIAGIVGIITLVFSLAGQVGQSPDWKKIALEAGSTVLLLWFVLNSYAIISWVIAQFGITVG